MSRRRQGAVLERDAPRLERSKIVQIAHPGPVEYGSALAWQADRAGSVAEGTLPEIVALLEHPPVYTQGRRGGREHVLAALEAPIVDTDRGGDVTFHGPGQLIVWPILRLRERGIGIARYVRGLEQVAIDAAAQFGVDAGRVRGRPGVWIDNRKLASVGVRLQSGVSRHGLALNCDVELSWFDGIRACGVEGSVATSLSAETGEQVSVAACLPAVERAVAEVFQLRLSPTADIGGLP